MTIDLHAHYVPGAYLRLMQKEAARFNTRYGEDDEGRPYVEHPGRGRAFFTNEFTDKDAIRARMDKARLDRQIFSPPPQLFHYDLAPAPGLEIARLWNDSMAELTAEDPERFCALASVPLQSPEAAATELRRAVKEKGLLGVEIATNINGKYLDESELDPFFEEAASLGAPVLVHPWNPPGGDRMSEYALFEVAAFPFDSTVCLIRLMLSGTLDRFPDVRFCFVHAGAYVPTLLGRIRRGMEVYPDMAGSLKAGPEEYLRRLHFDTIILSAPALRFVIDCVGIDRLFLGSDHPFGVGDPDPVASVEALGLPPDQEAAIMEGNAKRLLGA
ncbi:MAG: amidohydrolase family protein [Nitrospinota bacterium]|nr:amidohydrolase family protein [Nitrospinota bacterium]MDP6619178.1 amidohydrolase family protein [Nitrospinota bacterium]